VLADEQKYINSISQYSESELRAECISLFIENRQLKLDRSASERINTEAFIQYDQLKSSNDVLIKENKELKDLLEKAINKYDLRAKSTFGRKTEGLLSLIDSASNKADEIEDEAQYEEADTESVAVRNNVIDFVSKKSDKTKSNATSSAKSTKTNRLAKSMQNLPREIYYDIDVNALDDKYGAGNWRIAFWHEHTTLEKIDTPFYQRVIYTPAISVGLEHRLYSEPYENPLIDRSVVSESIMEDLLYRKFALAMPFNRLANDYQTQGIDLTKQNIINWTAKIVPKFFRPVVEYLTECLMKYRYTQNDETYIQVNKDERGPGHKSYMWVHTSSDCLDCNPIVIFCYEATRNTDHLRSFYKEFMGYITCDAYISYQVLEEERGGDIKVGGCLMHCRRYFAEAFFINDISSMSNEQLKELPETKALFLIRDIYLEENKLKDLSANDRLTIRQEKVSPLVDRFFKYVHELAESEVIFSDRMTKAIAYAINQESHLRVFLTDGNICCDNGNAERKIRAYSVGRANWLFCDTVAGAEINAIMYSVVETAKANGVNVMVYLRYLLEEMPKHLLDSNRDYLATMVPWSNAYKSYESAYISSRRHLCQNLFTEPQRPKTPIKSKTISKEPLSTSA